MQDLQHIVKGNIVFKADGDCLVQQQSQMSALLRSMMLQRPPPLPMERYQPLTQWPMQLLQQLLMHLHTIVRSLARRETGVRASQVLLSEGTHTLTQHLHATCSLAAHLLFILDGPFKVWCLTQNCRLWSRVAQRPVAVVFLWECKTLSGMASWNLQMLEVFCQAVNHLHHTVYRCMFTCRS